MSFSNKKALNAYGGSVAQTEAPYASQHRLVQIMMEALLTKFSIAKGHMSRKDYAGKGEQISLAITIVAALQASLDLKTGGEIAANLDDLYSYITERLVKANIDNDPNILDEVSSLIGQIKEAWDAMPENIKNPNINQTASQVANP